MVDYFSIAYQKMYRDWQDAQYNNDINFFIEKYDLQKELEYRQSSDTLINIDRAKIIIFGALSINKEVVYGLAKDILGIQHPKDRIDFVSYEEAKNFDFRRITREKYTDIFIGPLAHKTGGTGKFSSFLSNVKANYDVYPNYIEMKSNQDSSSQKITKESLKNAFYESYFYSLVRS